MSVKRRNHSPEFKFRTALEAAKEQKTISQLASELNLHPNQISNWKKHLSGNTPETPNPKQNAKKRKEGKKSNHALRCIANSWVKITYAMWRRRCLMMKASILLLSLIT